MANLCGYRHKIRALYIFLASNGIFVYVSCSASSVPSRVLPRVTKLTVTYRECIFTIRFVTSPAFEPFSVNWKNLFGFVFTEKFSVNTYAYRGSRAGINETFLLIQHTFFQYISGVCEL